MVVQSSDHGSISVRHSGGSDFRERVIDATFQIMDDAPRTLAKIETWKQIALSPPQRDAFAAAAMELKPNGAITPGQLLTPRRAHRAASAAAGRERNPTGATPPGHLLPPRRGKDRRNDLWTTASVVQEHVLRGGDRGRASTGRRTTTRAVKSVGEDLRLNRA